jgi:dihydropteroate synthase
VIEAIRRESDAIVSIDTTRAGVAAAALDAGAAIVNDVSAGMEDPAMLELVADRGCGLVLMHRLAPPDQDVYSHEYRTEPGYDDVTAVVVSFLRERLEAAMTRGVDREAVVLDPGLGFGKSVEQNYRLVRETPALLELGRPLLSAASRKSFVGVRAGVDEPAERDAASLAVTVAHWLAGVRLFRVHHVRMHRQALLVAESIASGEGSGLPGHLPA